MSDGPSSPLPWTVFRNGYTTLTTEIVLVLLATLILSVFLFKKKSKPAYETNKLLPPGPNGLPILGFLPFLGRQPHITYNELSKTYGPIIRVKLGSTNVCVLHTAEAIKEGLNKEEVLARPPDFFFNSIGVEGIVSMNGQPWLDNRRFCLHVLRDLGFGKKSMEEHVREEVAQLCDLLQSMGGKPKVIMDVLTSSISNNITALIFGERFHYDDPRRHFLDKRATSFVQNASFAARLDFLPTLRRVISYIPSSKVGIARDQVNHLTDFMRKEMNQRSKTLDADANRDFIDAYLKKINENNGGNASFSLMTLTGNTLNLLGAGTNTLRVSMEWHLLNCARDPEGVQRKLQQEVDHVVGRARAPEWEDRHKMPYTMAVIWEMLRWRTVAPLGVIREAARDTTIGGFHVPAGTIVLPNIWAVHHDPKVWEHPSEFDPTRFLNDDHTQLLPKPAALLPFSTGRRMCPGETLALMELFIYLTTILQRFTVLPKEGETLSMEIYEGLINLPLHCQELRFLPR